MKSNYFNALISLIVVTLLLAACGDFGPPPECAESLGGTADEALFAQYFNSMELVSAESGQPGAPTDNGAGFAVDEPLAIQVGSQASVTLRACIQFISGRAIALDQNFEVDAGHSQLALGAFAGEGTYVVRVIVDGVLVKNLPFSLQ